MRALAILLLLLIVGCTFQTGLVYNDPENASEDQASNEPGKHWRDILTDPEVFSDVATMAVTIALGVLAYIQMKQLRRANETAENALDFAEVAVGISQASVEEAKEASRAAHRAAKAAEDGNTTMSEANEIARKETLRTAARERGNLALWKIDYDRKADGFGICFINMGRTPAIGLRFQVGCLVLPKGESFIGKVPAGQLDCYVPIAPLGFASTYDGDGFKRSITMDNALLLIPDEMKANATQPGYMVVVHVRMEYQVVTGERHRTAATVIYDNLRTGEWRVELGHPFTFEGVLKKADHWGVYKPTTK